MAKRKPQAAPAALRLKRPQAAPSSFEIRAGELGQAAFRAGIKSAPALDPAVLPLLAEASKAGQPLCPVLDAWNRAWHAANIAAN